MSITMRLSLGMAIFAALFLASTGYVARSVFVTEINEIVEDSLAGAAQRMMPLVQGAVANYEEHHSDEHDSGESHDVLEVEDDFALFLDTGEGFLAFQVTGPDGAVILRSKDARGITFPPNPRAGFVETPDVLAYTEVDAQTGLVLTLIVPAMHRGEAVAEATRALAWPLTFLVPLMILGIFILVRLSLAPLGELRRQIVARGGSNLTPIEAGRRPAELTPIVAALDRLMERLTEALEAERVFASNAAHELRTPIAGALAQAQRLKEEVTGEGARARVSEIEATLKKLSGLATKLLQLSRAEAGLGRSSDRTDMLPILEAVVADLAGSAEGGGRIRVENRLGQPLMVGMDPDAFAIALRNLVENALRHGERDAPVEIVIGADWKVRVINSAPVLTPEMLAGLKTRFARGDSRADGSGLGLSIADRLLAQSGGALTLLSPASGRSEGFEAVMDLP